MIGLTTYVSDVPFPLWLRFPLVDSWEDLNEVNLCGNHSAMLWDVTPRYPQKIRRFCQLTSKLIASLVVLSASASSRWGFVWSPRQILGRFLRNGCGPRPPHADCFGDHYCIHISQTIPMTYFCSWINCGLSLPWVRWVIGLQGI